MLSAGSITVKCGDVNDKSTRLVAGRLVARFASRHYRIFKASSGLHRKKRALLDAYVKNPGDKAILIKIMRGVRWNHLSKSFHAYFMKDFAASSAGKFIGMKYNRRSLNSHLVIPVWRQVFTNRPTTPQCSAYPSSTLSRPVPLPLPRPVTPAPSNPRPANMQLARQNVLVEAVRKVYGASKSESYARTILKTQRWRTLKELGIATAIMKGFARLGYRRAGRSESAARRLIRKTLRNWDGSSGTAQPVHTTPAPQPRTPPRRASVAPARPAPSSARKQAELQGALVSSVRTVYGASKSESYVKSVLKTQSWSTLKQLGIVKLIMRAFKGLGYRRAGRSESAARKLVDRTVKHWK